MNRSKGGRTVGAWSIAVTLIFLLDGLYTFFVNSDDGSKLYLGDSLVVSNDGLHGSMEKSGEVLLKAGKHRLKLLYFDASGGRSLVVSYSGPGIRKQEVPAPAYSH